ncbi:MAG TPA: alpha/beta hydrolase [Gaiellales bacterium]|nr:alpha/beta hydrolase [Gaiellales bacterium]
MKQQPAKAPKRGRAPVPRLSELKPRQREITLHGHHVAYREAGDDGPVLLLIHGITGCAKQWDDSIPLLAERYKVIAPDLLGHGESAKPRGDYSLGAYAAGVRDLLVALGHRRATVVGHSLGGGIAMQFAYEYPPFAERLVLVNSGGLGREVHPLLRAASLPGSEIVLPLLASSRVLGLGAAIGSVVRKLGLRAGPDLAEMARGYASLGDAEARQAFVHTIRAVIDPGGQRVSATDRLYLTSLLPSLLIWGGRDPLIPIAHAEPAHEAMPGNRLEIFEDAGHFPQLSEPVRFAHTLIDFMETTEGANFDFTDEDIELFRQRLLAGAEVA